MLHTLPYSIVLLQEIEEGRRKKEKEKRSWNAITICKWYACIPF
jgi:hypothetical protein